MHVLCVMYTQPQRERERQRDKEAERQRDREKEKDLLHSTSTESIACSYEDTNLILHQPVANLREICRLANT